MRVKNSISRGKVKKGDVHKALIVRIAKEIRRIDGSYIKFDENAAVLLNKQREHIGYSRFWSRLEKIILYYNLSFEIDKNHYSLLEY